MKNLLLLSILFVSVFSFAQTNGLPLETTIEVTHFDKDAISYKHIQGSLFSGENCFNDVAITDMKVMSLHNNGQAGTDDFTLSILGRGNYKVAPSDVADFTAHYMSFANHDQIVLASDDSVVEEDFLGCPTWVLTDEITFTYTNTQYPDYSIRIGRNTSNWVLQVLHLETRIHAEFISRSTHTEAEALQVGADYIADL